MVSYGNGRQRRKLMLALFEPNASQINLFTSNPSLHTYVKYLDIRSYLTELAMPRLPPRRKGLPEKDGESETCSARAAGAEHPGLPCAVGRQADLVTSKGGPGMRAATQRRPAPQGPWPRNAPARSSLPGLAVCNALALGYAAPHWLIHSGLAASRVQSFGSIPAPGGALRLSRIRRRRPGRTWDALMPSPPRPTHA